MVVLIPLVGLGPIAYTEVRRSGSFAADAAQVSASVELLEDTVHLMVPLSTEATATSGARSAELSGYGKDTISLATGIDIVTLVGQARSELDAELAQVTARHGDVVLPSGATIGEEITAARAELATARQAFDRGSLSDVDLDRSFGRLALMLREIDALTEVNFARSASNRELTAIVAESRTFGDAIEFAVAQLESIGASAVAGAQGDPIFDLLVVSGSLHTTLDRLELRVSPERRRALADLREGEYWERTTAAERRWVLAVLNTGAEGATVLESPEAVAAISELLLASFARLDEIERYATQFLTDELALAHDVHTRALSRHHTVLLLTDGAIALTLVLLALVVVSVLRPLRSLLHRSHQVREGYLDAEPDGARPSGPHDIKVLTQTFNEMVATLRAFDTQVQRLARGDTTIDQALPGPLGETLRDSVDHLAEVTHQLHLSEAAAMIQARTDALTGLANRTAVLEHLDAMGANARDRSEPGAIIYLDLDGFKSVNDTQGHGAGDRILRQIGARLRNACPHDVVARMGGDEFIVLIDRADDLGRVEAFASRLIALIGEPCEARDGKQFTLTASAGVTLVDGECEPLECIAKADTAVYRAKESGRNCVEAYDEQLAAEIETRSEMALMMTRSLESGGFSLHFQPVVELASGRPVAVEALLRWTLPDGRQVGPSEFIPIAERTGVIAAIDEWVLDHGIAVLGRWQSDPAIANLPLSLNISGRDLADRSVVRLIADKCAAAEVDPHLLQIEITETYLMADARRARIVVEELKAMGVSVAIDDFGTGYSSLSSLHELDADTIKIDKMFIAGLTRSSTDRTIVELVLRLADSLGMRVIAEGVDSEEKKAQLIGLGCRYAQGYHLISPCDLEACTNWLHGQLRDQLHDAVGHATAN